MTRGGVNIPRRGVALKFRAENAQPAGPAEPRAGQEQLIAMKTIKLAGELAGKFVILAAFAAVFTLLFADAPAAEPTKPSLPAPTVSEAISAAETKAAAAVLKGNLADAKGWTEVAMQLRAGQYLAPFGDIAGEFAGQIKNARAFIGAAADVEDMKPVSDWYHNRFSSSAMQALFIKNDPAAFKLALVKAEVWSALRNTLHSGQKLTDAKGNEVHITFKPEDYQDLYIWVNDGCTGEIGSPAAHDAAALPAVQQAIAPLRAGLAPAVAVASWQK